MLAETVLSLMLSLAPPGGSIYSQVEVSPYELDAPCSSPSLLCRAPRYNRALRRYERAETREEGLRRYWTIAEAIERATPGQRLNAIYAIAIMFNESGFRRDVHSGIGAHARGDNGLSNGLGQMLLRKGQLTLTGYSAEQLVGLDPESTFRTASSVVSYAKIARKRCALGRDSGAYKGPACVFAEYGQVKTPGDERILLREGTFSRLAQGGRRLTDRERKLIASR